MRIVIKNGSLVDPSAALSGKHDIFIMHDRISEHAANSTDVCINAEGYYVSPGFIDYHTHVFTGGNTAAVHADQLFPFGTTTVVDAGSAGITNFDAFYRGNICHSQMRILAQLCVCPVGQPGSSVAENHDPVKLEQSMESFIALCRKYPSLIKGVKIKYDSEIVEHYGVDALKAAKIFSQETKLPLIAHTTRMPTIVSDTLKFFSTGDVYSHMYHGKGNTILGTDGHIDRSIVEARNRGVLFDAANGISNFSLQVAKRAIAEGFTPDIISSDATTNTFARVGSAQSLVHVMSKYLELGMALEDVIRAVTATPAAHLKMEKEIGTLSYGASADVVVYKVEKIDAPYIDCFGQICVGHQLIVPKVVISQGRIVYRAPDFFG